MISEGRDVENTSIIEELRRLPIFPYRLIHQGRVGMPPAGPCHMINDIWGLKYDPDMAKVAAKHKVPVALCITERPWITRIFIRISAMI